jgi:hypothetical protein
VERGKKLGESGLLDRKRRWEIFESLYALKVGTSCAQGCFAFVGLGNICMLVIYMCMIAFSDVALK